MFRDTHIGDQGGEWAARREEQPAVRRWMGSGRCAPAWGRASLRPRWSQPCSTAMGFGHKEEREHLGLVIMAQPCTATGMFCKEKWLSQSYRTNRSRTFISVLLRRVMV